MLSYFTRRRKKTSYKVTNGKSGRDKRKQILFIRKKIEWKKRGETFNVHIFFVRSKSRCGTSNVI